MVTHINVSRNLRPPVICHSCNKARCISKFCRSRTQSQESPKKPKESILDTEEEVKFVKVAKDASLIWSEAKKDKVDEYVLDASTVDAPSTFG